MPTDLRRSITWDQGKEMNQHIRFSVDTGVVIYFCDPKSPWQRGSNEDRALRPGLDVHLQRLAQVVDDPEHSHRRQSHQKLAHARRVNFHRGSPELDGFDTIKFAEPLLRARDAQTPLISEAPDIPTTAREGGDPLLIASRVQREENLVPGRP